MSSPNSTALEQLRHLDRSSSNFHDQLSSVLSGKEYELAVSKLEGDDLVLLVDYLDRVRRCTVLLALRSDQCRHSTFSIPQVPVSGNAYASLEKYVVLG